MICTVGEAGNGVETGVYFKDLTTYGLCPDCGLVKDSPGCCKIPRQES
jgi:rubredoxin